MKSSISQLSFDRAQLRKPWRNDSDEPEVEEGDASPPPLEPAVGGEETFNEAENRRRLVHAVHPRAPPSASQKRMSRIARAVDSSFPYIRVFVSLPIGFPIEKQPQAAFS